MAPKRIIIDTDPGVDDIMALLLALSADPEELEVLMISVTYGNVPLQTCLRNVMGLFHVLDKELQWRAALGRQAGYRPLDIQKPIVAIGPKHPLADEELKADFFHGVDGLHGVHAAHPDLAPAESWGNLFDDSKTVDKDLIPLSTHFTASKSPSHKEIIRILKENSIDSVTILSLGPLTNMALAAAEDPEAFLRVKELVVMGGAVHCEGNCTPVAEFNCYADPIAAARIYALTSPQPQSTMPPTSIRGLKDYCFGQFSRQLKLTLCPLDITTPHLITQDFFAEKIRQNLDDGSPLARWTAHFVQGAFEKIRSMNFQGPDPALSLHDPLTVWYVLSDNDPSWQTVPLPEDIRVETCGQWTRGMHVIDNRGRERVEDPGLDSLHSDEVVGDDDGWLSVSKGNRIHRIVATPGEELFKEVWMSRVFG